MSKTNLQLSQLDLSRTDCPALNISQCEVTEAAEAAPARGAVAVPGAGRQEQAGDMAQSYHEIFDTQGYSRHGAQAGQEDSSGVDTVQVGNTW